MDIQQTINLRLHRELTQRGIEFAYPTQKLYVVSQNPPDRDQERAARTPFGGEQARPAA